MTPDAPDPGTSIPLPPPPRPVGSYAPVVQEGGLAWVAGQIALHEGAPVHPGLVDRDVGLSQAQEAARQCALQGVSAIVAATGGLDRIRRVLRVGVYVASSPGFTRQHEVANGATDVLVELLGERGKAVRASLGVASLPLNSSVMVELVVATQ